MKVTLTIGALLFSTALFSQSTFIDGRGATGQGLWSENISGTTSLSVVDIGVLLENKFGLSELNQAQLRIGLPNKYGIILATWTNTGDEIYNINDWGISFSRFLSPMFAMGLTARYKQENMVHDKYSAFLVDIGMQYKINDKLNTATFITNPFKNSLEISSFQLSLEYQISPKVNLSLSSKKQDSTPISLISQIKYFPISKIALYTSISTQTTNNAFGIAFIHKSIAIDAYMSYHNYLGFSPQIALTYSLN